MAPPASGSQLGKTTLAASTLQTQGYANTPYHGYVEELCEGSPADCPRATNKEQQEMLDLINNTSARNTPKNVTVELEKLSQYENANGNSSLTPKMHSAMPNK